ncbi:unnamed protein product [Linum trigynum]|uniref:Uncharacterized protein n=1 Tax=Linum trigynum TaxID=586398 RepID=A0AAV2F9T5_9ROSI
MHDDSDGIGDGGLARRRERDLGSDDDCCCALSEISVGGRTRDREQRDRRQQRLLYFALVDLNRRPEKGRPDDGELGTENSGPPDGLATEKGRPDDGELGTENSGPPDGLETEKGRPDDGRRTWDDGRSTRDNGHFVCLREETDEK